MNHSKPKLPEAGERRLGGIQRQLTQPGSKFRRYWKTTVGDYSWGHLILYEIVLLLVNLLPSSFAQSMRLFLFESIFGSIGIGCTFGKNLIIRRPKQIYIGNHVTIEKEVSLDVKAAGKGIYIADNVTIGAGSIVSCTGGVIRIGYGSRVGERCRLGSSEGLTIGKNTSTGDESYLIGAAHAYDRSDIPIIEQPLTCRGPNWVGDEVMIGKGTTIRDGVHIGNSCHIGDHSLVLGDLPDNSDVEGVPAIIKGLVS